MIYRLVKMIDTKRGIIVICQVLILSKTHDLAMNKKNMYFATFVGDCFTVIKYAPVNLHI